ncbi:MAG: MgtC/SapB family protein [Treponema sp.]|jgi:putative Mg2+ transporter-C (MgtC) family protein|nr:MgtC/SapB family protein [Treponema sp.]
MENAAPLTEIDMLIRLGFGFLAGAIIGFERSSRHQVAGLRTHILIAVGATLLMLLSIWLPQEFNSLKNGDPGRIAAQVVSGIGFLGAGAILRLGNNIRGLTTAASLWLIAAVGLAIGAGMYIAAAAAEVISLITLFVLDIFEKRLFPSERNKILELQYKQSSPDTSGTLEVLKSFGIRTQSMDVNQGIGKGKNSRLRLLVSIPDVTDIAKLAKALKSAGEVARIEIKEKY